MARLRACIDRIVPDHLRGRAAQVAIAENPANARSDSAGRELALETGKLWKPGRVLRVRFLEGDGIVKQRVEQWARVWEEHANIRFDFVDSGPAEIRIAFADDGSWSAVGTDALVTEWFGEHEATMNYGWLTPDSSDREYSSVVLHEFGHALGCIHEHQSPGATINWNKPVVYRDLAGPPNFWDKTTVDHNVFGRYSATTTQFSEFDPKSIMLYSFPTTWTLDGQTLEENPELSATDKAFIAGVYPREMTAP
ncbi:MAG: hypothetical protein KJ061_07945 [Vicinamibacteraceae bacterium]|nr:hypothetical protein [Vicinamibacteraceae bacterium]